ncbi:hypothetical protein VINI7043_07105 [Vibrio nigripulchritudo ATCC 27043]|uniref:hypothetical protein n=1 Tax=Vibrio nigripulchritudo TaxID=28173 RepID=UPI00021C14F4|nr:hypothetical protein [Vibrio nigripulchritudo]EGU57563.1 hypothetical protein VINI7043_07105 [Vibrio nigripulchritudo ATCC 27043]
MKLNVIDGFKKIYKSSYDLNTFPEFKIIAKSEFNEHYIDLIYNETIALELFNKYKIKQTNSKHYLNKLVKVKNDLFIITGIRFYSGDVNTPFVEILPDREISNLEINEIKELIAKTYRVFNPKYLMIASTKRNSEIISKDLNHIKDDHILIGRTSNAIVDDNLGICIKKLQSMDFYLEYNSNYSSSNYSNIPYQPKPEDISSISSSIREGLCFGFYRDTDLVAIIAGVNSYIGDLRSFYIIEKYIFPKFRGNGYSKICEIILKNELYNKFNFIWGTINDSNKPSLYSALSSGRKIIKTNILIPLGN